MNGARDIIERLAARLGHRLDDEVVARYERGLEMLARRHHQTHDALLHQLRFGNTVRWQEAMDAVLVHETYFFRDAPQFATVAQLARAAALDGRPYRSGISLGCSTGEEAYSLALVLWSAWPAATVVAYDVSHAALAVARAGEYGARAFREVPVEGVPDLEVSQGTVLVSGRLKAAVRFAQLNVADPVALHALEHSQPVDVVVCRNVLMYLKGETAERARAALASLVLPHGCLVLGALDVAEPPPGFIRAASIPIDAAWQSPVERVLAPFAAQMGAQVFVRAQAPKRPTPKPSAPIVNRRRPELVREARALADVGELRAALRRLEGADEDNEALLLKGHILLELGEQTRAELCFRAVLMAQPQSADAAFHLLLVLSRRGDKPGVARLAQALEVRIAGVDDEFELAPGLTVSMVRQTLQQLPH